MFNFNFITEADLITLFSYYFHFWFNAQLIIKEYHLFYF